MQFSVKYGNTALSKSLPDAGAASANTRPLGNASRTISKTKRIGLEYMLCRFMVEAQDCCEAKCVWLALLHSTPMRNVWLCVVVWHSGMIADGGSPGDFPDASPIAPVLPQSPTRR